MEARSYITPHVKPYYDAYASSYVEQARPYAEDFNQRVYAPSLSFGKQIYEKYGAPRIGQARGYGQNQWEKAVKPKLEAAQAQAKKQYNSTLAPQVSKVSTAVLPYYMAGRDNLLQTYNDRLLPAYNASRPYVEKLYASSHEIALETGLPYVQSAWTYTVVFIDRTLWPKLTILYGESVEPQLVRIGERLGRYRDGRKLKAALKDIDR